MADNQTLSIGDFIKETIVQITKGLHEAQEKIRSQGTQIFPNSYGDFPTSVNIDFDLVITQSLSDGGAHLSVASLGINAGIKGKDLELENSNRVKFTVQVGFVVYNPPDSRRDWSKTPKMGI